MLPESLRGVSRDVAPFELGAVPMRDRTATHFRVWAPRARSVTLEVLAPELRLEMQRGDDDVFAVLAEGVGVGADYAYLLDGDRRRPDPCSRHQPHGVHGSSRVVNTQAFAWTDARYRAPTLQSFVIY